jgi:solute carrier family 39 (zinc transporter), member 1/2/3
MSDSGSTAAVKIPVMIFMFLEVLFFGSLPLRLRAFKENKLVLSMSGAFSGGLFLGIGLIHLLPESNESFENYYKENDPPLNPDEEESEHFPWAFFIATLAFALILFIEKILTAGWG